MLNLIAELKRELGFAAMIVTHNLAMIRHVSDRLAIMYLGRLVETGPTQDVFAAPLHPYTATLIQSEPVPDPRRRRASLAITRRDSERVPPAFRLRVPHALPDRARALPDRGAGLSPHAPATAWCAAISRSRQAGKNGKPFAALPQTTGETDMIRWNTDRRNFLKAAGALGAAADDQARLRLVGRRRHAAHPHGRRHPGARPGLHDRRHRGRHHARHLCLAEPARRSREGAPWSLWGAEKLEQTDPKSIAFTLIDGLKWSNGLGPVTAEDVKFSYERIADPKHGVALGLSVRAARPRRGGRCAQRHHPPQEPVPADLRHLPALLWRPHRQPKAGTEKAGGKFTTELPATCGPYLFTELGAEAEGDADRQSRLAGPEAGLRQGRDLHRRRRPGGPARLRGGRLRLHQDRRRGDQGGQGKPAGRHQRHRGAVDALHVADRSTC